MLFKNRKKAGRFLSQRLLKYRHTPALILALPRGGVPVAAEIALDLQAPLDVLVVRKIGVPFQPEVALGAVCEYEEPVWNQDLLTQIEMTPQDLTDTVAMERNKIERQIALFRKGQPLPDLKKRTVILVDDGLATGATVHAAIQFLRKQKVGKIVAAIPVAATEAAEKLKSQVDELVTNEEKQLLSVGQWYEDFTQVSDEDVLEILHSVNEANPQPGRREVEISIALPQPMTFAADLTLTSPMKGIVIFAHGSGHGRHNPYHQQVARHFNAAGFGTLLFDLLTDSEAEDQKNIFAIDLLSARLVHVTRWLRDQRGLETYPIAYYGAGTGAAASLQAAGKLNAAESVFAVISRGLDVELPAEILKFVTVSSLLLVPEKDEEALQLNRELQKHLIRSKLSVVPGAMSLSEDSGVVEEVAQQSLQWLEQSLRRHHPAHSYQGISVDDAIQREMIPVEIEDDYDALIESLKDKRVVMLGEASHGTQEFYEIRRLISQRLIREHGFRFIAVEGDWPDAYRLHRYIQGGEGKSAKKVLLHNHRWPTWMWANEEVVRLAEWMYRNHQAGFYGLDVYSLFESIDEVISYMKAHRPDMAYEIEQRYACFDLFEGDEYSYVRSLWRDPEGCESEVLMNLRDMLHLRLQETNSTSEALFNSQQNARIVMNAEAYYRAMLNGDSDSWNVRDSHMMETLDILLDRAGEGAKAIVWAHNTHVGDYRATDMEAQGAINIGGLARQKYGEENVALVGFGTFQGTVLAGSAWGSPEQVMKLPPAPEGTYEHFFHKVAVQTMVNQFYLLLHEQKYSPLAQRLGHRAVGVVYDPRYERPGNYVPTQLARRYDAFIFVDQTKALTSLHTPFAQATVPETWPLGQ
jgi:erythromycin esterase-like protein/predicted phosphoribosyltransferase